MEYLREEYHNLQREVARLNKELEVREEVIEELMDKNAELKKYGSEMYIKYQETKRQLEMLLSNREKEAREIISKKEEEVWEK